MKQMSTVLTLLILTAHLLNIVSTIIIAGRYTDRLMLAIIVYRSYIVESLHSESLTIDIIDSYGLTVRENLRHARTFSDELLNGRCYKLRSLFF